MKPSLLAILCALCALVLTACGGNATNPNSDIVAEVYSLSTATPVAEVTPTVQPQMFFGTQEDPCPEDGIYLELDDGTEFCLAVTAPTAVGITVQSLDYLGKGQSSFLQPVEGYECPSGWDRYVDVIYGKLGAYNGLIIMCFTHYDDCRFFWTLNYSNEFVEDSLKARCPQN